MTTATALSQPTWRDGKRYAWLLGLLVPLLPFMACGLVQLTGPRRLLVLRARSSSSA